MRHTHAQKIAIQKRKNQQLTKEGREKFFKEYLRRKAIQERPLDLNEAARILDDLNESQLEMFPVPVQLVMLV